VETLLMERDESILQCPVPPFHATMPNARVKMLQTKALQTQVLGCGAQRAGHHPLFNKSSASKRYKCNIPVSLAHHLLMINLQDWAQTPGPTSPKKTPPGLFISGALQHIQRTPRALHLCRPAGHPRDVAAIAGAIEAASASLPAEDE
jgi:hypothetical protein